MAGSGFSRRHRSNGIGFLPLKCRRSFALTKGLLIPLDDQVVKASAGAAYFLPIGAHAHRTTDRLVVGARPEDLDASNLVCAPARPGARNGR
jgi:hypothetical protein